VILAGLHFSDYRYQRKHGMPIAREVYLNLAYLDDSADERGFERGH